MNDLMLLVYLSPPFIAIGLLKLGCYSVKKYTSSKRRQQNQSRKSRQSITRGKELNELFQIETPSVDYLKLSGKNRRRQKFSDYRKNNPYKV